MFGVDFLDSETSDIGCGFDSVWVGCNWVLAASVAEVAFVLFVEGSVHGDDFAVGYWFREVDDDVNDVDESIALLFFVGDL